MSNTYYPLEKQLKDIADDGLERIKALVQARRRGGSIDVSEESLAVTCPHCGHTSDVRIPARKP